MSLSFVVPKKQWGTQMQKGLETSLKSAKRDQKIWKRIEKDQKINYGVPDDQIKEYVFDMKQVEGFRYRMEDGLRSVTRAYVREARIKEIKNEVLNSDKLKVSLLHTEETSDVLRANRIHVHRLISKITQEISLSSSTTSH